MATPRRPFLSPKLSSRAAGALHRPEVATSLGLSGLVSPYIRTAPDVRDRTETARQRLETVQAVVAATSQGLMSDRSAVETLRALFPDMKPYEDDGGGEGDDADADAERRLTRKLISEGISASFAGKPDSKEDEP